MKRLISTLLGLAVICFSGFAFDKGNGISSGGFWAMEGNLGQGYGEWSFPVFSKNDFFVRDNVTIGGFGGAADNNINYGGCEIGNNVLFGGVYDLETFKVKAYGFFGVDYALFTSENHKLLSPSGLLGTVMGGGFEFQYSENNAFVVEYGGKYRCVIGKNRKEFSGFNSINPVLMLGYRSYY